MRTARTGMAMSEMLRHLLDEIVHWADWTIGWTRDRVKELAYVLPAEAPNLLPVVLVLAVVLLLLYAYAGISWT